MSIHKMMALHTHARPEPKADAVDMLATASRHAMFCAAMCTSCTDACLAEDGDMGQCIRLCLDCADICAATTSLAVRQTGQNGIVLRAMLETCILACEQCAEECARHDHEHCRLCAEICRECADDCRKANGVVH